MDRRATRRDKIRQPILTEALRDHRGRQCRKGGSPSNATARDGQRGDAYLLALDQRADSAALNKFR